MNGLLAIAAAFLDLMTNPQHGIEVNEEYSLRFHQALIDDPEFANSFATLALSAEDVESLPICAWPWYLQWRAGNGSPPSRDFLDALFDYTDDPAIRLSVVRSAVWEEYPASTPADHPPADAEHRSDDDSGDRRFTGARVGRAARQTRAKSLPICYSWETPPAWKAFGRSSRTSRGLAGKVLSRQCRDT